MANQTARVKRYFCLQNLGHGKTQDGEWYQPQIVDEVLDRHQGPVYPVFVDSGIANAGRQSLPDYLVQQRSPVHQDERHDERHRKGTQPPEQVGKDGPPVCAPLVRESAQRP